MKTSSSLARPVQGVSQQAQEYRLPGQVTEQSNLVPDPKVGLSRRWGTAWQAERLTTLSSSLMAAYQEDTNSYRTFEYTNGGVDYVLLYRSASRAASSDLPPLIAFNKTTGTFLTFSRNTVDAVLDQLDSGGATAITAVGRYIFIAGALITPAATSTDLWGAAGNQSSTVLWVRGGAYSRKYSATVTKTDDTQVSFEYTTPASSYPNTLDTSSVPVYAADPAGGTSVDTESLYVQLISGLYHGVLNWGAWGPTSLTAKKGSSAMTNTYPLPPANDMEFSWSSLQSTVLFHSSNLAATDVSVTYTHIKTISNPSYARIVSEMTNEFNSAVTNWIGTAAEAIQPQNIAEQLKLAAVAAGLTSAVRQSSSVIFDNVKGITVSDSGDGTLVRGVANEVQSIDDVSTVHKVGKVVRVKTRDNADALYLKAVAKDTSVTSGYTEVTWVEGAGVTHAITSALIYATIVGNNLHVASTAALLNTLTAGTHPNYETSTVGDLDSVPLPFFIGRRIDYLGVFQDRLLIGSGCVLRASKIGDYLNFFRSTLLTVPADDPMEFTSQGNEDDTLRFSVLYDKSLILFGDRRQYAISGRDALTPTNPRMPVMSNHKNAGQAPPLAVGDLIFYANMDGDSAAINQIQPGQVAESPNSYPASAQLNDYIAGDVIEMASISKPTTLVLRTTGDRSALTLFSFIDSPTERPQAAWHRWTYGSVLGPLIGMLPVAEGLLTFHLRLGGASGTGVYLVCDLQRFNAEQSNKPYLDSQRGYAVVESSTGSVRLTSTGDWFAAYANATPANYLIGKPLDEVADLIALKGSIDLWVGYDYPAYVIPTNPVKMDYNGNPITTGLLTVSSIVMSLFASTGYISSLRQISQTVPATDPEVVEVNGMQVGDGLSFIGRTPITSGEYMIDVGLSNKNYEVTLKARKWFPFCITALDWIGQWFNRTRRS